MNDASFSFSSQQVAAIDAVGRWLRHETGHRQVFRLFGYAGTGKTTIARYLAEGLVGDVVYAAYTGKAALMMAKNGCHDATTIHRQIYRPVRRPYGVEFHLDPASKVADAALVIIDECSMIGEEVGRDLLSFNTPILLLGDPAQLPPVESPGFFTAGKPDVMLTEIHRQAKESPIVQLATAVREGKALQPGRYGDSRVIPAEELEAADLLEADQILVGLNKTCEQLNNLVRMQLGRETLMPEDTDRLLCLKNDYDLGIFNGSTFKVVGKPRDFSFDTSGSTLRMNVVSTDFSGQRAFPVKVRKEMFLGGADRLNKSVLWRTQHFSYGYAMTAHRAQGSQWPNVIVCDESDTFPQHQRNWLYTAITRASERVTISLGNSAA